MKNLILLLLLFSLSYVLRAQNLADSLVIKARVERVDTVFNYLIFYIRTQPEVNRIVVFSSLDSNDLINIAEFSDSCKIKTGISYSFVLRRIDRIRTTLNSSMQLPLGGLTVNEKVVLLPGEGAYRATNVRKQILYR